jgi:hypothetical protein
MFTFDEIINHVSSINLQHKINLQETPIYVKKLITNEGIREQSNCTPKWILPINYLDFVDNAFYPKREFFDVSGKSISQEEYISYILTTPYTFNKNSSIFDTSTNIKWVNTKEKEYVLTYSAGSSLGEHFKKYLPVIITNN